MFWPWQLAHIFLQFFKAWKNGGCFFVIGFTLDIFIPYQILSPMMWLSQWSLLIDVHYKLCIYIYVIYIYMLYIYICYIYIYMLYIYNMVYISRDHIGDHWIQHFFRVSSLTAWRQSILAEDQIPHLLIFPWHRHMVILHRKVDGKGSYIKKKQLDTTQKHGLNMNYMWFISPKNSWLIL